MFKIADLTNKTAQNEGVWVTFKDTPFQVRVVHYGKQAMQELADACRKMEFDITTLTDRETMDREKFRKEYSSRVIREWKGLTKAILAKLIVVDPAQFEKVPVDFEFPCDDEAKEYLVQNSLEFDQWLQRTVTSIETFNARKKEADLGN